MDRFRVLELVLFNFRSIHYSRLLSKPKTCPSIKKSILHTLKLQGRTVETFEWAEEAKSRDVRNKDPRYQRLLKARALDPLSQKKLSSVQSKFMYLEQQMDEVNTKLDMEWDAHLEKCKVVYLIILI
jgi:hypothetical protein